MDVALEFPCPKIWSELQGEGGVRHCSECAHDVQDLSVLPRAEAEELVERARHERICLRMQRDAETGRILTREDFAPPPRLWNRVAGWFVITFGAFLASCGGGAEEPEPQAEVEDDQESRELLGMVAPAQDPDLEKQRAILSTLGYACD